MTHKTQANRQFLISRLNLARHSGSSSQVRTLIEAAASKWAATLTTSSLWFRTQTWMVTVAHTSSRSTSRSHCSIRVESLTLDASPWCAQSMVIFKVTGTLMATYVQVVASSRLKTCQTDTCTWPMTLCRRNWTTTESLSQATSWAIRSSRSIWTARVLSATSKKMSRPRYAS